RPRGAIGRLIMPTFSPALITIMRAVLEEAMTKVPAEQATTVTKAYLAEFILKAAAEGLTNYEGLMVAAINQLPIILSMSAESLMLYRIVVQVNRIQNARPAVFDQPRSHDERTRWKAAGRRPSQGSGQSRQRAGTAGSGRNRRAAARIYAADHARSERTSRPARRDGQGRGSLLPFAPFGG